MCMCWGTRRINSIQCRGRVLAHIQSEVEWRKRPRVHSFAAAFATKRPAGSASKLIAYGMLHAQRPLAVQMFAGPDRRRGGAGHSTCGDRSIVTPPACWWLTHNSSKPCPTPPTSAPCAATGALGLRWLRVTLLPAPLCVLGHSAKHIQCRGLRPQRCAVRVTWVCGNITVNGRPAVHRAQAVRVGVHR